MPFRVPFGIGWFCEKLEELGLWFGLLEIWLEEN
jgi:hypothetical protein